MKNPTWFLLAGSLALGLVACDENPQAGGTSDDTHTSIHLTGRVFDGERKPVGEVVATLRSRGIADTTDADGRYDLLGEQVPRAARSMAALDTVDFSRDGVVLQSVAVSAWVDTLPDVFLVQRDISGEILSGGPTVEAVEALLWTSRGDTLELPVEWNPVSRRYSGFLWSRSSETPDTFFVQVRALDSLGRVLGISQSIRFTSRAGDVLVPAFSMESAVPRMALLGPKVLIRGGQASFQVEVEDPLQTRLEVEWSIQGGLWVPGGADTTIMIPPSQAEAPFVVRARVRRQDGVVSVDSLVLDVDGSEPWASIEGGDAMVYALEPFRIRLEDSASGGGRIVRRWIGAPWNVEVSGRDTVLRAPGRLGAFSVVFSVLDDRGSVATDTLEVTLLEGFLPGFEARADSGWFRFRWGKMTPGYADRQTRLELRMTDSTLGRGRGGFRFVGTVIHSQYWEIVADSLRFSVFRQSAAKSVRVDLSRTRLDGSGTNILKDSSFTLNLPPLVWNFEGEENWEPVEGGGRPYLMDKVIWPHWQLYKGKVSLVEDPVFGSRAAEIQYEAHSTGYGVQSYAARSQAIGHVTGWKDVRSLSMDLRGTPKTGWLWLDPFYGDEGNVVDGLLSVEPKEFADLRAQGITLGWPVVVDSVGKTMRFDLDSLRWSDGVARSSPSSEEIVKRAVSFRFNLEDGPGTLVFDNVRFERR